MAIDLPPKFQEHILNGRTASPEFQLMLKVQAALSVKVVPHLWFFQKLQKPSFQIEEDKDHVRLYAELPGWVIKGERRDLDFSKETHLYRVRKARRIQQVIEKNHWQDLVVVPKKYLYFCPLTKSWFVVAEKIDLQKERSYEVKLSVKQAEAVAAIALETCMTDLHGYNLLLDKAGRVALIDTEPVAREKVKWFREQFPYKYGLLDIDICKLVIALCGTHTMKSSILDPAIERAVERVEWKYISASCQRSLFKASLFALGYFYSGPFWMFFLGMTVVKASEAFAIVILKKL